jgi:hypothetical protein
MRPIRQPSQAFLVVTNNPLAKCLTVHPTTFAPPPRGCGVPKQTPKPASGESFLHLRSAQRPHASPRRSDPVV